MNDGVKEASKKVRRSPSAKNATFSMSASAHAELEAVAARSQRTISDVLQLACALAKIAIAAEESGQRLVLISPDGRPIEEIVLPKASASRIAKEDRVNARQ